MRAEPSYTLYHPRWYRRRVSVWWWLQNRRYAWFVLRELTSVFVALFAGAYLWQLRALAQGPEAYAQFLARLGTPLCRAPCRHIPLRPPPLRHLVQPRSQGRGGARAGHARA